jgi:hypothetical protein
VISRTIEQFWNCFNALPANIQKIAREKYALWERECFHPSLRFKPLRDDLWSVRINQNYRALGRRNGASIVWFWIGTHADYDRLVASL